jgi:hypothetical protein
MTEENIIFEQPFNFVRKVKQGKHIVLFYEEPEYARMILFEFIISGLSQRERCIYVSEEEKEAVEREMSDAGINVNQFTKSELLSIHQIPNLAAQQIPQITLERLAQITVHPWTKEDKPERVVLRCIFKTDTEEQISSNLKWERDYRYRELRGPQGTMICTYPVNNIIPTISDPEGYGKWMNELLEIYDGVIFARKFWKGVAFTLE